MATRAIGASVPRKVGREKATGGAKHVDDIKSPGRRYGVTVQIPPAREQIPGNHFVAEQYYVPLLLRPFRYSTYRGS